MAKKVDWSSELRWAQWNDSRYNRPYRSEKQSANWRWVFDGSNNEAICLNTNLADDGFCQHCDRNHFKRMFGKQRRGNAKRGTGRKDQGCSTFGDAQYDTGWGSTGLMLDGSGAITVQEGIDPVEMRTRREPEPLGTWSGCQQRDPNAPEPVKKSMHQQVIEGNYKAQLSRLYWAVYNNEPTDRIMADIKLTEKRLARLGDWK